MEIEIKSAEIKSRIFLKYNYDLHEIGRTTKLQGNCDAPIHEDLATAFQKLVPHFLLLSEMKNKPAVVKTIDLDKETDEELLKKFKIKSFTTEEKNGETYVQITGYKILTNGKTISFSTPSTAKGNDEDAYEFYDKMLQTVDGLKEEIMLYIEGKQAERAQKTMEFGADAEDFDVDGEGENENQLQPTEEVAA